VTIQRERERVSAEEAGEGGRGGGRGGGHYTDSHAYANDALIRNVTHGYIQDDQWMDRDLDLIILSCQTCRIHARHDLFV